MDTELPPPHSFNLSSSSSLSLFKSVSPPLPTANASPKLATRHQHCRSHLPPPSLSVPSSSPPTPPPRPTVTSFFNSSKPSSPSIHLKKPKFDKKDYEEVYY
ncbi:hypothetical protein RIF29_25156 [Crotalaria pallida]|uniref:Uncharacterized protein n=1 Tax=Crotalaria pallida TaxID=3830 RepID=A0AAN9EL22_CROPI